jgi:hypothetical protein
MDAKRGWFGYICKGRRKSELKQLAFFIPNLEFLGNMSNIFIKNISKSYICRDGAMIFIINIVKTTFFRVN